jgi:glycosyltransferase involved in cell wall biosynthesis
LTEKNYNIKILIIGYGMHDNLNSLVKKLKLEEHVVFPGMISHRDIPLYINASDVCVITRPKGVLGSPLKVFEYMACSRPIILTKIEGLDDIEKYSAGILVNVNIREIADEIIRLLTNKNLRIKLGENGRKLVLKKYTWDISARKTAQICKNIIRMAL